MNPLAVKAYGLLLGAALAAAGIPVSPGGLVPRAVVSYGHQGTVRDIAADGEHGLLFTTGDDGTLRVWDEGSKTLVRRLAITRQTALSVAIDPAAPLAAVLVSDGARASWIDVWDWNAGTLRYRVPLEAAPLFVRFSLSGSYLLCGAMTWESLRVYRVSTGDRVAAPDSGGMVGFAEVSRSDSTLMTYRLSGDITYRDLVTGTVRKEVPAAANLLDVRASADRRWLAGHTDAEVLCLDAVTGETRLRIPAAGVVSLDISDPGDRIAWVTADGATHEWSADGAAALGEALTDPLRGKPRVVRFAGDDLLLGGEEGRITRLSQSGTPARLAEDILAVTSGIAMTDSVLMVAAGPLLHAFQTSPRLTELFTMPSPFGAQPIGLAALADGRFLAWSRGDAAGRIGVIDCGSRTWTAVDAPLAGPLAAVAVRDRRLYTLERGGRILGMDLATGRTEFEASRPGAICIAAWGDGALAVGSGQAGALGASLVRIDTRTAETVAVPGRETVTYALAVDARDGSLYSLGVDRDGRTKLVRHAGPNLAEESLVDTGDADLSASLAVDPASGVLYSSLGRQRVTAWFGGSLRTLGAPSPGIELLTARDGLLAAAQKDSTVSLWDSRTDRPAATLYPFSDGSWVAILADGSVQGVPAGMAKVSFFAQGRLEDAGAAAPPSQETPVVP